MRRPEPGGGGRRPGRSAIVMHDEVVAEIQQRAAARHILTQYFPSSTRVRGDRGAPDLVLAGDCHVGWIEVKMPGDSRSPDQTTWFYKLRSSGALVEVMGPADLAEGGAVDLFLTLVSEG